MSRELVTRLRRLDCCAVSDAIDKLRATGIASSAVTGVPQQSGTGRIAGLAVTVELGVGAPPAGSARHLGAAAIELSGPDNVIVVEQRTGVDAACWGGLLSLGAKVRGVAGLVADGPVRDIDEARSHDFPIFARSLTAHTARGRIVEIATNEPVILWDVAVNPGDYVIADNSAVIFIQATEIEVILNAAEEIAAKEAAMAKALLDGVPVSQVMGSTYENLLK